MKKIYLLLFSLLVISGCQKDEITQPVEEKTEMVETVSIQEAIDFLGANKFKMNGKSAEAPFVVAHPEGITQEEILNSNELLTVIPAKTKYDDHYSRILLLKMNNEIKAWVFNINADQFNTEKYFSGELLVTDLEGNFIDAYRIKNGMPVSQFIKSDKSLLKAGEVCTEHKNCTSSSSCVACIGNLNEVNLTYKPAVSSSQPVIWYIDDDVDDYGNTDVDELQWYYDGKGGGGTTTTPTEEEEEEEEDNVDIIVDPDFLKNHPCAAKVVEEAYGVCSPLTSAVLAAFEANDGSNLTFSYSSNISANAETTPLFKYIASTRTCDAFITFRESYITGATDLSIARTTIHESLHATLVYMLEEGLLQNSSGTTLSGFEDLVETYINYLAGKPENLNRAHHELMSDFVGDIATSLSSFGRSKGYNLSIDDYKDLAWGGLTHRYKRDSSGNLILDSSGNKLYEENPLFKLAEPLPSDRQRIMNRLESEATNSPVGNLQVLGKLANSTIPCN